MSYASEVAYWFHEQNRSLRRALDEALAAVRTLREQSEVIEAALRLENAGYVSLLAEQSDKIKALGG